MRKARTGTRVSRKRHYRLAELIARIPKDLQAYDLSRYLAQGSITFVSEQVRDVKAVPEEGSEVFVAILSVCLSEVV